MMSRCTKGTGAVRLGVVPNQLLFSIKSGDSSTFGLKTYFFLMGACVYDELYTYMEWNWNQNFISPRSTFKNKYWMLYLGFLTGWDCATFCDKGKEVSSLSCIKGTTGQAQNLAMGCDRPGQAVKIRDRMRDWTITIFLSKSGTWVILSLDVPGQRSLSRNFCTCPCPGTKGQRDRQNFFVPGQRDNGTSRPLETLL